MTDTMDTKKYEILAKNAFDYSAIAEVLEGKSDFCIDEESIVASVYLGESWQLEPEDFDAEEENYFWECVQDGSNSYGFYITQEGGATCAQQNVSEIYETYIIRQKGDNWTVTYNGKESFFGTEKDLKMWIKDNQEKESFFPWSVTLDDRETTAFAYL